MRFTQDQGSLLLSKTRELLRRPIHPSVRVRPLPPWYGWPVCPSSLFPDCPGGCIHAGRREGGTEGPREREGGSQEGIGIGGGGDGCEHDQRARRAGERRVSGVRRRRWNGNGRRKLTLKTRIFALEIGRGRRKVARSLARSSAVNQMSEEEDDMNDTYHF